MVFCYLLSSPLKKGMAIHFNNLECPSPKDATWQVWLKFGVYRQTDGWTTYDGQQIRKAHLSLDELNTELCL